MNRGVLALFLILAGGSVSAQRWSVQLSGGFANYQGDLQEKRFTTNQAGISLGVGAHYDLTPRLSLRTGLHIHKIEASDKLSNRADLRARNLDFSSNITEGQLGLEFFLLDRTAHRLVPYLFASAAVFRFDPYTYDSTGNMHYLQPLRTEGQGLAGNEGNAPYKTTQFAIPFGGGIRFALSDRLSVGYELGFRKTFTDYLDDVSTRYYDEGALLAQMGPEAVELAYRGGELKDAGNADYPQAGAVRGGERYKDWYYNSVLTLQIRLFSGSGGMSSFGRRKGIIGCPPPVL